VDVDLLDALMRQVGELGPGAQPDQSARVRDRRCRPSRAPQQRLNLIAGELQEGVMKTRMQPIDHVWSKMRGVVRDLAVSAA